MRIRLLTFVMSLLLCACGPVIGDRCTVNTECGEGVCLQGDVAPGGLCSRVCIEGGPACPAGSVCIPRAVARDTAGCLLSCKKDTECRPGYTCRTQNGSLVCLGPGEL